MKRSWVLFGLAALAACHADSNGGRGSLRGQIVMHDGAGYDGIAITLVGPTVRATLPDASGGFALADLPSGAYALFVDAEDAQPAQLRTDVAIVAQQETTVAALALDPTARVTGRVLVDGTTHHEGTTITSSDGRIATTNDTGDFDLAVGLAAQTIVATRAGSQPLVLDTKGLARGVTIDLVAHTLVAGATVVFDVIGAARIAGAIDRANITVAIDALGITAKTDADGRFVLPSVAAGAYALRFERGDMHDTINNVLVGLGEPKVITTDLIYDLGTVEIMAGKRLTYASRDGMRLTAGSEKYAALRTGLNYDRIELWDLATDQRRNVVEAPFPPLSTKQAIAFDGDIVFVLGGFSSTLRQRVLRLDPTTNTTTEVATDIYDATFYPAARTTVVMRRPGGGAATLELYSWNGGAPSTIGGVNQVIEGKQTMFLISSDPTAPHTWRRVADGAILASLPGTQVISRATIADDEKHLAVQADDHFAVIDDTGRVQTTEPMSGYAFFAGDFVWFSYYPSSLSARRISDLGEVVAPMTYASIVGIVGDTTLVSRSSSAPQGEQLLRFNRDASGGYASEAMGTFNYAHVANADGFWLWDEAAIFVPRTGPISVHHDGTMLDVKPAGDGALLYLDAASATGSALRRLSPSGVDTVVADDVVSYVVLDADLLANATVGDHVESFLVRPATGERLPLGVDSATTAAVSTNDYYVGRRGGTGLEYRSGLFRLHFANPM